MVSWVHFDLTQEPWIPCERPDGTLVEVGLAEVLTQAQAFRMLRDPSPLVTATLHRLLLAILHRIFGPPNLAAWKALYRAGRFDANAIEHYLSAWRHRFDLFHPERPFYQVRGLAERYDADPISRLIAERSNWGPGTLLFAHRIQDHPETLSPAATARQLVALHAFAPGGLVKKRGEPDSATAGPLNRGAVVLLRGDTVFETLMLNLVVYTSDQPIPSRGGDGDAPAWERDAPTIVTRRPDGWVDLLTWQSRRLELVVDDGGQVSGVVYCVGQALDGEALRDPMVAYRRHEKLGFLPVAFDEHRVVWRDFHALVRPLGADAGIQPRTLGQIAVRELRDVVPSDRQLAVEVLGQRSDQAKILLVRAERFPIAPRIVEDPDRFEAVREVLKVAEDAAQALRLALRHLAQCALGPGARTPDKDDVTKLLKGIGAETDYWAHLGGAFEAFLGTLIDDRSGHGPSSSVPSTAPPGAPTPRRAPRWGPRPASSKAPPSARHRSAENCASSFPPTPRLLERRPPRDPTLTRRGTRQTEIPL